MLRRADGWLSPHDDHAVRRPPPRQPADAGADGKQEDPGAGSDAQPAGTRSALQVHEPVPRRARQISQTMADLRTSALPATCRRSARPSRTATSCWPAAPAACSLTKRTRSTRPRQRADHQRRPGDDGRRTPTETRPLKGSTDQHGDRLRQRQAGRHRQRPAEPDSGGRPRRRLHPALLLAPGPDRRRQLPHVPGRGRRDEADGKPVMQPKVVPGCQTPAKDGTVIVTNSREGQGRPGADARRRCCSTIRSTAPSATRPASACCRISATTTATPRAG